MTPISGVVRTALEHRLPDCPFCVTGDREILLQTSLAVVWKDEYPVTRWHVLVVPKRHTLSTTLILERRELRACQALLSEARSLLLAQDVSILGFNVGINSGEVAGQTIMHSHVHLIPRRAGDIANPRGRPRCYPGRADYKPNGTQG